MVLGKKISIPSMVGGLSPVCEDNKQVTQYLTNTMAQPGLSKVITCFFVQGIGNSKFEHAAVVLSFEEDGEKDIDERTFSKIKEKIIKDVRDNSGKVISESRKASIKRGFQVSSDKTAPSIEIKANQVNFAVFQYQTKVPLKSVGREVEKLNTIAVVRVKNRVLLLSSYAYEVDLATKNQIFRNVEAWITSLLSVNV